MSSIVKLVVSLCCVVLCTAGSVAWANPQVNEAAAFLVFPAVSTTLAPSIPVETLLSVHNTSAAPFVVRFTFVSGDDDLPCYTCDFDSALPARGTITVNAAPAPGGGTRFRGIGNEFTVDCPFETGFVTVNLKDATNGLVRYDNVLIGSQVVVGYAGGRSHSVPAIPFQGISSGDGDTQFEFDAIEFQRMPRILGSTFMAPDGTPGIEASLVLFTLGFERQVAPITDCSITAYDTNGNPFSRSLLFGCWTQVRLADLSPEFLYPNLGAFPGSFDEHGWMALDCRVDTDADSDIDALGGVHGILVQRSESGAVLRRQASGTPMAGATSWSALALQSVTQGGSLTLELEAPPAAQEQDRRQR